MEKIKLSIAQLFLYVLLTIVLGIGAGFLHATLFPYVVGFGLIASVVLVVLFFFLANNPKEVEE